MDQEDICIIWRNWNPDAPGESAEHKSAPALFPKLFRPLQNSIRIGQDANPQTCNGLPRRSSAA
jgi:hypothetical protein